MTIERRANPCPLSGTPADVWWCTDCNRVIELAGFHPKPDTCPLWACVERREREASVTTESWHVHPKEPHLVCAGDYGAVVCECRSVAHARLIASAPALKRQRDELLEACKAAVHLFRPKACLPLDTQEEFRRIVENDPTLKQIHAAIAHARPETTGKAES